MAATDKKNVRAMLAVATGTLLCQSPAAQEYSNEWITNLTYLDYRERDRISVQSYIANIRGQISDDARIQLGVVLDTMTGATPTGAIDGDSVVTSTGTSGGGFDVSGAGTAMAEFSDTRLSVDANWEHSYTRLFRVAYGGYASVESDFTAIGGSIKASLDINNRLTTLSVGVGAEGDKNAKRDGTTPGPMTNVEDAIFYDAGRRNSFSGLLGVTQVLDRRTVAQFNVTYSHSLGYHTDPYKVFSMADSDDVEMERFYEGRPDERRRLALYSSMRQQRPDGNILGGSVRLYGDDWGVQSITLDSQYRYSLDGGARFIEPFGRFHFQTAADFYLRSLEPYAALPEFASSDSRLAQMQSYTVGLKFSIPVHTWGSLQPRLAYFHQEFQDATHERNQALIVSISFENTSSAP
ncbi:DUF3570 domain-containing protein [Salinispirillum sp. LH 10-3-1]|uniref:DUF3570 domain-containing protein n=1 Tax=Salinispirillum sp. LH 10-3-1 TaxID=2952525 RepID=A0AB38YE80_9GAMM